MKIYIPSRGRAGKVSTIDALLGLDVILVVPILEVEEYKKFYKNVIGCPVSGITKTRNWILDNSDDKWVIQVDDDADGFYFFEKCELRKISDSRVLEKLFLNMFVMSEELGTNLWGLQLAGDKKFYREYSPFSFSSVIVSNIVGIIKDEQRFDERLIVKEDYDFSLMALFKHKRTLRNNKYFIRVKHLDNVGGVVSYRTRETELMAYSVLRDKWGSNIVQRENTRTFIKVYPPVVGI